MRSALTAFLIISFLGIAVFGIMTMNHDSDSNHNGCIASTFRGVDCPANKMGTLSFVSFILDAFKDFSTAVFGKGFLTMFLFSVALLLAIRLALAIARKDCAPLCSGFNFFHKRRESFTPNFQSEFTHWLALHENSPAVSRKPI